MRDAERRPLAPEEAALLTELLVIVVSIPDEFRKWTAAFNTYPLRYPLLHPALGNALAHASHEVVKIYVDSIALHPIRITDVDESCTLVGECFRGFAQEASPSSHQAAWTYAHQRWLDWRFGASDPSVCLFDLSRTCLDFAVVSYICECMNDLDREAAITDIRKAMNEIDLNWHRSESEFISEWHRLWSILQPYAGAVDDISSDSDVRAVNIYYPFDISRSLYHRLFYNIQ